MLQRGLARQARRLTDTSRSITRPFIQNYNSAAISHIPSSKLAQPRHISSKFPAPTRAKVLARWYSQEPSKATEETSKESDESPGEGAKADTAAEDSQKADLEAKNKEIVDLKDKYLRQVAEFRNLQERTRREVQAAKDFAIQRFARDLVESIDTFDLALSSVPAEKLAEPSAAESEDDVHKDLRQLYKGLRMTEDVLLTTLKKHGLERFDPSVNADKFDPNIHEATFQTPQPDKEDGTVFYTTQKGFILNGRVLRAAKVGVVKNS